MDKPIEALSAQERDELNEARRMFDSISEVLGMMLEQIRDGDLTDVKKLYQKQSELQTAALRCHTLKEQFRDKYDKGPREGEFDLEQARFDIGCKLARLRSCGGAGALSCELERERAGGVAVSV